MYLALYRKYRPQTFDDVVAQPHITVPLKNQVKTGKTAHAYLFSGSRGTGKTSCGKILAKAVNCPNQVDGNPCLTCDVCKGIDSGSLLDVTEIDAASNNGVDNIREIREEANFTPAVCKYRVYIIDEAHMLSDGAFNALLKIMEEPPPHILFILATTEVHKIPATILSRCQRFDFKRIPGKDIADRLLEVAKKESLRLEPDAATLIAKIADGGMRDALSLFDRCTAMSEVVDVQTVSRASGLAGRDYLFRLTDAILQKDVTEALQIVDRLNATICNLSNLCDELISHFRNLLIAKTVTKPDALIVAPENEIEALVQTADRIQLGGILEIMERLQDCSVRMKRTTAKKLELEMTLVRICSPNTVGANGVSDADIQFLRNRIDELEQLIRTNGVKAASPAAKAADETPAKPAEPKKSEKIDFSKFQPVACFQEILDNLKQFDPAIAGVLYDAKAYEHEDVMLIVTPRNLFADLFRNQASAQHFSDAVFKQTGKRYRFKIKQAAKAAQTPEEPQPEQLLDKLVEAAKSAGVDVD